MKFKAKVEELQKEMKKTKSHRRVNSVWHVYYLYFLYFGSGVIALYRDFRRNTVAQVRLSRGTHYMTILEYPSVLAAISELVGVRNDHQLRLLEAEAKVGG